MMVAMSNRRRTLVYNYVHTDFARPAFFIIFFCYFFTFSLLDEKKYAFLCIVFVLDGESTEKQHHRTSRKAQRKEFMERMHARNGKASSPSRKICLRHFYC